MATATQNISVRITVLDGDKARRELILTGEQGQLALKKIKEATAPAARELLAVNVAGEQLRYGMENLSRGSGTLGLSLARLGPVGLAAAAAIGAVVLATAAGLREFKNAEQALNQFNAALRATDSAFSASRPGYRSAFCCDFPSLQKIDKKNSSHSFPLFFS